MKNDPQLNVALVEIVEKYPELYDYSHEKYSNKLHVEKVWNEIGKQLNETGAACRERWGNLRGNYSRALKPVTIGNGPKIKKEYYLSQNMSFLLPFMKSKSVTGIAQSSSTQSQSGEKDSTEEIKEQHYDTMTDIDTSYINEEHQEHEPEPILPPIEKPALVVEEIKKPSKKKIREDFENTVIQYIKSKKEKRSSLSDQEDADFSFLKSLLPEVSKLDSRKKNLFKVSVISLLHELIYGEPVSPVFVPNSASFMDNISV
ncbi:transcription factor Adf-1-like [Periplaneta americana]|uniref:transcription factor Adf-1-like n=1 Tax=Periplaneta americana TaxID=6978 RepID=UPI0037E78258